MHTIAPNTDVDQQPDHPLDSIARWAAERMIAVALEAEADAYVARFRAERDDDGRAMVVRNGHARERTVLTGAGAIKVKAPRVNDKHTDVTGERRRFASAILPPYMRRSPKVDEVLPLLYLHGLSTKDFTPALEAFFGSKAGLSASVITRLATAWQSELETFGTRDLSELDYVYIWVDGVHFRIRLGDDDKLCCLVIVGVRADGTKELVALSEGYRESIDSWAELLRDCRDRGMRAPVLATGDGALGFWGAIGDVFTSTRHQRDWFHKTSNVLDALPADHHDEAKDALRAIWDAENKTAALKAARRFQRDYVKFPKAVAKITKDLDALVAFYDFPAEHWIHLRTSNPIESTFATVRLRTAVTKGPGSRDAGIAMVYKVLDAAGRRWRKVNAPHLVALVRAGAKFTNGKLVERTKEEVAA